MRAALDIRADTGTYNSAGLGPGGGGGGGGAAGATADGADAAVVRPLRDAVLQALASLPEMGGVEVEQEGEERDGDGAELRPPRIELEFAGPVTGAAGWWASLGGQ